MTRDQFTKRKFKAYEELMYCHPRHKPVSCMLLAIDWDKESVLLTPFDKELYDENEFLVSRERIEFPKKLKIIK